MCNNRNSIILYGSYGYTGTLIARECKSRKLNVILSGRKQEALQNQSKETGYPFEVVEISDSVALRNLLYKGKVVIHCGGPFQYTAKTMVEMCLSTQTHYTDITGEYQVFEMLATYDALAKKAGITLLPGTGFDVVPSDCLAVFLKMKLPSATHLELAFIMSDGGLSRGTAKTMIEGLGKGSVVRIGGSLVHIPLGKRLKNINFGSFETQCLNIPWGDVSTAWHSTGIADISVYMGASGRMIAGAKMSNYFNWILRSQLVKKFLLKKIDKRKSGPSFEKRSSGKCFLWGKVWDDSGNSFTASLETVSGYQLTAKASVLIAEKILSNNFKPGFQTPGMAYGADLVLELENTIRKVL